MSDVRAARVLAPLVLGMFARALQLTVIGPSLLNIAHSLNATLVDVGWIMALYAAGSLIAQPIAGTISDVRGRRFAFCAAVVTFAVGSIVCALSTSLAMLIAGRIVQSLGAGAIQPAAAAIVGDYVPAKRQGAALGTIYGAFALAAVVGSVVGGLLVDGGRALALRHVLWPNLNAELASYPWHLVFWVNLPIAIATLGLSTRLPGDVRHPDKISFDGPGALMITAIAACLMFAAVSRPAVAALWLVACAAAISLLILRERAAQWPLLDLRLFAQRGPAITFAVALASGIPIFSVTMYGAAYYMEAFHANAAQAGVAMLALGIPLGAGLSAGGPLINRFGPKAALAIGALVLVAGDLFIATARATPGVLASFAVCGAAMGLVSAPPNVLIYRYVPAQLRGAGVGIMTMFASSGAVTAPAVVTAFLHYHYTAADPAASFRAEFAVAFAIAIVCVVLVAMLPQPPEASPTGGANPDESATETM